MLDNAIAVAACTALLVGSVALAVGMLIVRDRIANRFLEPSIHSGQRPARCMADEAALLHPNWWFYEQHLQRPIPADVRALYADHRLLLSGGFQYDDLHFISEFGSIDPDATTETFEGVEVVPLAWSDGDIVYLRPGAAESNAVYLTCHDGDDAYELAPDPGQFLQRIREAAAAVQSGRCVHATARS